MVKESDFGNNDISFRVITHLGSCLQPGDLVLGYDLQHSVLSLKSSTLLDTMNFVYPDIVLVRKTYESSKRTKSTVPKKKQLKKQIRKKIDNKGKEGKKLESDYEVDHLEDLNDDDNALNIEETTDEFDILRSSSMIPWATDENDEDYISYQRQLFDQNRLDLEVKKPQKLYVDNDKREVESNTSKSLEIAEDINFSSVDVNESQL